MSLKPTGPLAGMRVARITTAGVVTEFGPGIDPMAGGAAIRAGPSASSTTANK